jgi:ribosomal subunit interface protein
VKVTPQIIFHDVARTEWVERYIATRVQRLERFAQGIVSVHTTLAREQRSHSTGNLYRVTVEVRLPPQKDLAARKERTIRDMGTQLRALIRSAFDALERQLKQTAEKRRYDVKSHDSEPRGLVSKLHPEGYGFIRSFDNQELYFHRNSVLHGDFERLTVGTEVRYSAEEGDEGPQASSVQVVGKPGTAGSPA